MMKTRLRLFALVCATIIGFSAAAETVEYWDPVGKVTKSVEAVVVTKDTATLAGGWYVVRGEVSRAQINVTGTDETPANLILADGAKLKVYPDCDHRAALHVPSKKALSIWATRENGTGAIEATGRYQGAGIGGQADDGSYVEACGTVSIYGGNVTAIGSMYAAGIGGGGRQKSKGGGASSVDSKISIYGGKVVAKGIDGGAAIGGGNRASGGTITIAGGEVIAENDPGNDTTVGTDGAGIGGGFTGDGGTITITGGKVSATGGTLNSGAAGIGGGSAGAGGTITISGGTVIARSGNRDVGDIGSGSGGADSGEFVVKGGSVLLANSGKCRDGYPKNGAGTQVGCVTHQFTGDVGKGTAVRIPSAPFDYGDTDIFTDDGTQVYLWLPNEASTYAIAYENGDGTFAERIAIKGENVKQISSFDPPSTASVAYVAPDGMSATANAIPVDVNRTALLGANWYVVTDEVTMSHALEVIGNANLILADGAKLTVQGPGSERHAGIEVLEGNALTIWGQDGGTGELNATGGDLSAGIGGCYESANGLVTINGGQVTATGDWGAAGIGGGSGGAGREIIINGGQVTAAGGSFAAGIGGGYLGKGGAVAVSVNGGTVVVRAGYDAPYDIGSGKAGGSDAGEFTVNGGSVLLAASGKWDSSPKNSDGELLYRVTIPFPTGFAEDVAISVTNIVRDGKSYAYGGRKLFVRDDGLYLFLPDGKYDICLAVGAGGAAKATATVNNAQTTAALITGAFLVDGASLVSDLPGGCSYTSGVLRVSGAGPYVFSGSPQELPLRVEVTTNATIVLSNVVIAVTNDQPVLTIKEGAVLTLQIAEGRSEFESKGGNGAIVVQSGANLVLGATGTAPAATRLCVRGGITGGSVLLADDVILKEGDSEAEAALTTTCTGKNYLELGKSAMVTVPSLPGHLSAEIVYGQADSQKVELAPAGGVYTVMQNDDIRILFKPDEGYGLDFAELSCKRISNNQSVQPDELPCVHPVLETTYWDVEKAEIQSVEAMVVDNNTAMLWSNNWYVVTGDVVSRTNITVMGAANLILADGARLTVTGAAYRAGIEVAAGNALTIWGQDTGTGTLEATGGHGGNGTGGGAGIGSGNGITNGTVTINGGTVIAVGADNGAGIGGGSGGAGGNVTISGGTVIAKAANMGTWDIGSGWGGGDVGDFFVTGGSVQLAKSGLCRPTHPRKDKDSSASLRLVTVTVKEGVPTGTLTPATVSDIDNARLNEDYGLGDYNTKGVQLIGGKFYFYLKEGRAYAFKVNDGELDRYVFVPAFKNPYVTTATQFAVFANGSPVMEGAGEGWVYDSGSGVLTINGETCSVAGFALQGEVAICVETNATLTTLALELMSPNSVLTIENGAAVTLEAGAEVTNRFITTGDRPAVAGSGSLAVTNGTYLFCGATCAIGANVSFAVAPEEIVLAGDDMASSVYVDPGDVGDAKWVKVMEAVTLTVPEVEHATFCASNRAGRLEMPDTTEPGKVKYRVMPGDAVTLFFTAEDGYALNETVLELGSVTSATELDVSALPVVHEKPSGIPYVDEFGEAQTAAEALVIGPDVTAFHDGVWYVVTGAVTVAESIVVDGTANLILADGATLTAGYDAYEPAGAAGIEVPAGATLNIYAQAGGTGTLVARGTDYAAGIGGAFEGDCGTVNISGGQVMAEGGCYAAGIGGGAFGSGGTVTIYDGTVAAIGGEMSSADIGPGYFDWYDGTTDAEVTILGGSLIAPAIWGPAMDDVGNQVHCVLVEIGQEAGSEEGRDERVVIGGLGDYGARDIFPYVRLGETTGNVYLYLPNGAYEFKIGRAHYAATVNGLGTEARLVSVDERPDPVPPVILAIETDADSVTVTVETLPGFSYSLLRGATVASVRGSGTVVDGPKEATETRLTLTDANPPTGSAFYSVEAK